MKDFHYTIKRGWMGDPNGLIYHNGKYHMFYQYEPEYNVFTPNMHWGHAYSDDLINWIELPIALKPDHLGAIWSGSAVIDNLDTSGFGSGSIVCVYTSAGGETYESSDQDFTISIAYSSDGLSYTKYLNNPVVKNISRGNRDPKIFWHKDKWYMILSLNNDNGLLLLHSKNLREWSHGLSIAEQSETRGKPTMESRGFSIVEQSETRGKLTMDSSSKSAIIQVDDIHDCPDIVSISNEKYLLFGTNGKYVIGSLINDSFLIESSLQQFAYGETYSSQTWNNEPNNKNIMIFRLGDMENKNHISQMSIPIELEYHNKLIVQPLKSIIEKFINDNVMTFSMYENYIVTHKIELNTCQFYLFMEIELTESMLSIDLIEGQITYDKNRFMYNTYGFDLCDNKLIVEILSDTHSIEIFINKEKYIGCFQHGQVYDSIIFNNMQIKKLEFTELYN